MKFGTRRKVEFQAPQKANLNGQRGEGEGWPGVDWGLDVEAEGAGEAWCQTTATCCSMGGGQGVSIVLDRFDSSKDWNYYTCMLRTPHKERNIAVFEVFSVHKFENIPRL